MDVGAIQDVLKEFNKETMKQEMKQDAVREHYWYLWYNNCSINYMYLFYR